MTQAQRRCRSRHARLLMDALEPRVLLASNPIGYVDVLSRAQILGWAMNSDDGHGAVNVEITVNGVKSTVTANSFRGDLTAPLGSPYHAFTFTMPTLPQGVSDVLVQAVSPSSGVRRTLRSGTVTNPAPTGSLDINTDSRIAGWAWDVDATGPIMVRIDVGGVAGTPFATDVVRPDVAAHFGTSYNTLGFNVTGSFGGKVVEVYIVDVPSGTEKLLYTNNRNPIGSVDLNTGLVVAGWAIDQDNPTTSVFVQVEIDGVVLSGTPVLANRNRSDLVPVYGSANHGFRITIPGLTPGSHVVAVYGTDLQTGGLVLLGSKEVNNAPPIGQVQTINSTQIVGWALDSDLGAAAANINVYVDDFLFGTFGASLPRPELTAIYGSPNHGFDVDLTSLPPGSHAVTVTVFDDRVSDENEVVIFDDFINNARPIGAFDVVNGTTIYGWAFDADAPNAAIAVDIYVDGVYAGTVAADQARADIDAYLPTPNHAFFANLPALAFGTHTIELYAAESQGNVSVLIGSKTTTNSRPVGYIDSASASTVAGWAADPDRLGEVVGIRVFINGELAASANTNVNRPDLAAISPFNTIPGFSTYGFDITLPTLSAGRNQIDVFAVDKNNNLLSTLGSRVINV